MVKPAQFEQLSKEDGRKPCDKLGRIIVSGRERLTSVKSLWQIGICHFLGT